MPMNESIKVRLEKTQGHFKRVRNPKGADSGIGEFLFLITITAVEETVYIPLSVASGKKPTGFVYQIEGTAEGSIVTTDITAKGKGVTQITLGTILYLKIPKGVTATFRLLVTMEGKAEKSYKIVINEINYKHDPSDARYKKYLEDISSKTLKFH